MEDIQGRQVYVESDVRFFVTHEGRDVQLGEDGLARYYDTQFIEGPGIAGADIPRAPLGVHITKFFESLDKEMRENISRRVAADGWDMDKIPEAEWSLPNEWKPAEVKGVRGFARVGFIEFQAFIPEYRTIGVQPYGDVGLSRMFAIACEVLRERRRQNEVWGEQNHPDFDPVIMGARPPGVHRAFRLADELEIPGEARAKSLLESSSEKGELSWSQILLEEFCEAIAAGGLSEPTERLRAELIQVAAVAAAWVESIDRRRTEEHTTS